jgi:hypothetical protein
MTTDLMNTVDFTAADLSENRNGRISVTQKRKLRRMRIGSSILPVIFIAGTAALVQVATRNTGDFGVIRDVNLRVLGASALLLASIVFFVIRWQRISADLGTGHVKSIHGRVTLGAVTRNIGYYGEGSRLSVGDVNFIIPFEARLAFTEGKQYQLYYAPKSKIVLSVDPRHVS